MCVKETLKKSSQSAACISGNTEVLSIFSGVCNSAEIFKLLTKTLQNFDGVILITFVKIQRNTSLAPRMVVTPH